MWTRYLPIVSGIFVGTSYIPFYPWALFFAWIPLWLSWLGESSTKKVFWKGWLCQFVFTVIGFHWITHVAREFGELPWPVAWLALILFAAFSNLQVPLSGLVWHSLHKKYNFTRSQSLTLLALLLIIFEYAFPMIFPWNMGYTWLYVNWPAYQWADVFGFQGLSALSILFNLGLVLSFEWKKTKKLWMWPAFAAALFFIFLNMTGNQRARPWKHTDHVANVLQAQANIGNFQKVSAEKHGMYKNEIIDSYVNLSREGLLQYPDTNFLIWPETAIPEFMDAFNQNYFSTLVRDRLRELGKPSIIGAYSRDFQTRDQGVYNALFYLDQDGQLIEAPYRKHILLAFGEYFPGTNLFPFLQDLIPAISDFKAGTGPKVANFAGTVIGPQICYEGLFPDFSRSLAKDGARILVNLTNDSWYDTFSEPRQHLFMTLGRAIEFRRPLIRTTNTGISTGILADGTLLGTTSLNEKVFQYLSVPYLYNPEHTFFEHYGGYYGYLFFVIFVMFLLKFIFNRRNVHSDVKP